MTRAQLRSRILAGDTLTIMGVPNGSGARIGIDRNVNGILDGDEPRPALRIARSGSSAVVAWPTNRSDYFLERAPGLSATSWNLDTSPRSIVGSEFMVTNSPALSNRFFRLRQL
jgi:hypothetical protein